jgi:hypothetical protein
VKAALALLALALAGCADDEIDGPQGHIRTTFGFCGTLQVSANEAVTPAHCTDQRDDCALLRDLCWISSRMPRVAEIRPPTSGENVLVVLPDGRRGRSTIGDVQAEWRTATLGYRCARGDSGGVVWGEDGAAICMLTGCASGTVATCATLGK